MKKIKFVAVALLLSAAVYGCADALQRGMLGSTYVSTARPDISIKTNLPLLTSCQGFCNLDWTGVLGGLSVEAWVAVYGQGGLSPMAIAAQAQVPSGWQWDADLRIPFSVDPGFEAFNGVTYEACTFLVDPARDPFGSLVTGVQPDGQPQLWMVRYFAARYNFNQDKIIMEYREPLPQGIVSLTALPYGQDDLLKSFAHRARQAFTVGTVPENITGVKRDFADNISWRYMDQKFLGTASKLDIYMRD